MFLYMSKSYAEYSNHSYELEHKEYMQVQHRGNIHKEPKGVVSNVRHEG